MAEFSQHVAQLCQTHPAHRFRHVAARLRRPDREAAKTHSAIGRTAGLKVAGILRALCRATGIHVFGMCVIPGLIKGGPPREFTWRGGGKRPEGRTTSSLFFLCFNFFLSAALNSAPAPAPCTTTPTPPCRPCLPAKSDLRPTRCRRQLCRNLPTGHPTTPRAPRALLNPWGPDTEARPHRTAPCRSLTQPSAVAVKTAPTTGMTFGELKLQFHGPANRRFGGSESFLDPPTGKLCSVLVSCVTCV